jgi:hypothetical protein
MTDLLTFSHGNAKLGAGTLIFSLPAGKTCPGALQCLSFAAVDDNGKRHVVDGPHTQFRCFAATSEAQYDGPFYARARNLQLIVTAIQAESVAGAATLINNSMQAARKLKGKNVTKLVRIHESGDFFSELYLAAWIVVARMNPDLKFYCYSKNLPLFVGLELPENFYMTASYGGKFDYMIDEGLFVRYSKVVHNDAEAEAIGLEVDHDDSHCFGDSPFALLVHSTQPKGSTYGKAVWARRKAGQFSGYAKERQASLAATV